MPEIRLTVTGMTCGHCEKAAVQAATAVDGVQSASADRTSNSVVVTVTEGADIEAVRTAIAEEGFSVAPLG
jgi:copper chaperone